MRVIRLACIQVGKKQHVDLCEGVGKNEVN